MGLGTAVQGQVSSSPSTVRIYFYPSPPYLWSVYPQVSHQELSPFLHTLGMSPRPRYLLNKQGLTAEFLASQPLETRLATLHADGRALRLSRWVLDPQCLRAKPASARYEL